jgi:adsorption protein B
LLLWAVSTACHFIMASAADPLPNRLVLLLQLNGLLLLWRAVMRFVAVRKFYGTGEGLRAIPRIATSNIIAMIAARRALWQYWTLLRGGALTWDKTRHIFPEALPAE